MSSRNRFGTILQIGDILVSEDVLTEWFACDYQACKGACCIIGDSGAPLEEHEPGQLEEDYDSFSPLMSPRGRAKAEKEGFFSIQNTARIMGIPYRAVGQAGIKKVEKWNYQCIGCGKWYKEKMDDCPICGSAMRAHRKR